MLISYPKAMKNSNKESQIIDQIKKVYDLKFQFMYTLWDLFYDCKIGIDNTVEFLMTLTSPICAMAGMIRGRG